MVVFQSNHFMAFHVISSLLVVRLVVRFTLYIPVNCHLGIFFYVYRFLLAALPGLGFIDTVKKKTWGSSDITFMAETVTERKFLDDNPSDMKTKMELLIMKIQVLRLFFCSLNTCRAIIFSF